ncbi:hypothetical protein KR009_006948, partial [Drosophila setifemur]
IVFYSIECSIKTKLFSKVLCLIESPLELTINVTIAEQEAANNIVGLIDLKVFPEGKKMMRLKNIRLELCHLKKFTDKRSLTGMYYKGLRQAAANFPEKCPFLKVSFYT